MTAPRVDSYRFGHIEIDSTAYENDVIIFPDHVRSDWWRKEGHVLNLEDLDDVFDARPETLVVGQGAYGRMSIPAATRRAIEDAGIEVVAAPTDDAVKQYNELREHGSVVAALHLTC